MVIWVAVDANRGVCAGSFSAHLRIFKLIVGARDTIRGITLQRAWHIKLRGLSACDLEFATLTCLKAAGTDHV